MGCVVNGPGKWPDQITDMSVQQKERCISTGTDAFLKNVPEEDAINELLRIINEDGQAGNQSVSSEDQPSPLQ